ncbi:MAG: hypothetical protein HGA51_10015 [Demequinaceae bacterium]|nr:hypothetical protein [Demequinaceae bacterium]
MSALRAANASIEASVTVFEVAAQLIAEGVATRRHPVPLAVVRPYGATESPAKKSPQRLALG